MKKIKYFLLFILIPLFTWSQETIYFNSANPFSFKDIIKKTDINLEQEVYGILKMPVNFDSTYVYPVVIAVAGSNGWSKHHYEYLDLYRANGIATFELCSFQSRGVSSTVGTQTEVTTAMMILDSYRAYEILQKNQNINPNKIAITGWSLGGGVALFSAWTPLNNAINKNVTFSAHLPIYPPCIVTPTILEFGDSPIHILIGELDNWTPPDACLDLVNALDNNNIGLTIYPEAHHSFDRNGPLVVKENGYLLKNCRFKMREDGAVLMNFLNIPMTTPLLQKIGLFMCAKRGPIYGGNPNAKTNAFNFSRDFMNKHLK